MYILAYGDSRNWNMGEAKTEDEKTTQCGASSCLEKLLITLLIIFVFGFCVICGLLIIASVNGKCITADCIKQAAWIQNALTQDTNPCEDFYKFVCPVNKDDSKYGKMKETARKLKLIVEKQIEDLIKGTLMINEDISLKALKQMYRGCRDVENKGKYLQETYQAIMQWGLLEKNDEHFDWFEYIQKARKHGLAYDLFLDISVVENVAGNGEPILRIGPPDVSAADSLSYITIDEATLVKRLEEITQKGLNNYETEFMTMKEFEEKYDFLPWNILPSETINNLDYENYTVLVAGSEYISGLLDLLNKTEESTIANFMQHHLNNKLSNEFVQWTTQDNYESYCVTKVKQLLPHFTQAAYMIKYHPNESLEEAKAIAEGLKNELLVILSNADWLNKKTKNYILDKIQNTNFVIGAPDDFLVNEFDFLADVNSIADTKNFLLMTLQAKKYNHFRQYLSLEKEKHLLRELSDAILTVYPFYSFKHNLIVVPAAVLQNPIFYLKRPRYLNYGLLGAIIGRELIRAFLRLAQESDEGCLDVDWSWTLQQIQCLEEQHSSYNYSDVSKYSIIKGKQIFADVAGTKLAYRAYQKRIQVNELDRALFGLNFTADQMFWIAKGLHGCYLLETFSANNPALSYMVMSPFMNLEPFTKDFACYKEKFLNTQCDVL